MHTIYNKYRDDVKALGRINADVNTFRPTFVIDEEYDDAYCEDEFQEMRIANVMFRQLGPTIRCKTTSLNWRLNQRDPDLEPFATIQQVRKHHKLGPLFGTYLQPEVIPTRQDFEELLPGYSIPLDRSFGTTGIIKEGDTIKLRKRRRTYYV